MSGWQVGDLAVCVGPQDKRGGAKAGHTKPKIGNVYTVKLTMLDLNGNVGLAFEGKHDSDHWLGPCWHSRAFRKIDKHEACEEEFVTLLKKRPVRVPVVP